MDWYVVLMLIAFPLITLFAGFVTGMIYRKKVAEKEIAGAEEESKRILNEAIKSAEAKKREALIEAKEEILKNRNDLEKDIKERRVELQKQEKRIDQKEESLDRKVTAFEAKEEQLVIKLKDADKLNEEVALIKRGQLEMLEKISGMSVEDAKSYLLGIVESECRHEKAMKIKEIEDGMKDEADQKAREIISLAIQRCSAEYVSEATVSVVPLPNDEMKGRIIGREGRNIRTLETLTGVDLIIDDTPEAITLSCFDPIRREIARVTLEKLILDGRIHPARIEEMIEKSRKEVEVTIKQEGERATFETGVHGLHPDIVRTLGKLRFRTSFGQNVLRHSIEVSHISGHLASELGVDVAMAKRAGLLHDIGKALDHEVEGSHVDLGVELAKKYKESFEVVHSIHAHHGDVETKTVIACIVDAADDISAARPGARRENLELYIKRLEKLEEMANSFTGVEKSFAIQAGREIRIIVKPDEVNDDEMIILSRELSKKIETELEYPGQIKVHVIRETRAIEYAK